MARSASHSTKRPVTASRASVHDAPGAACCSAAFTASGTATSFGAEVRGVAEPDPPPVHSARELVVCPAATPAAESDAGTDGVAAVRADTFTPLAAAGRCASRGDTGDDAVGSETVEDESPATGVVGSAAVGADGVSALGASVAGLAELVPFDGADAEVSGAVVTSTPLGSTETCTDGALGETGPGPTESGTVTVVVRPPSGVKATVGSGSATGFGAGGTVGTVSGAFTGPVCKADAAPANAISAPHVRLTSSTARSRISKEFPIRGGVANGKKEAHDGEGSRMTPFGDTGRRRLVLIGLLAAPLALAGWVGAGIAEGAGVPAPTMEVLPKTDLKYGQTVEIRAHHLPKGSGSVAATICGLQDTAGADDREPYGRRLRERVTELDARGGEGVATGRRVRHEVLAAREHTNVRDQRPLV